MDDQFITLTNLPDLQSAQELVLKLSSQDIQSFIRDEDTLQTLPFHGIALGGTRIQVYKEDELRAAKVLKEFKAEREAIFNNRAKTKKGFSSVEDFCPNCDTLPIFRQKKDLTKTLLSLLIIPMFFMKSVYHCDECKHTWKE